MEGCANAFDQGGHLPMGPVKLGDYGSVGVGGTVALIYSSPDFNIDLLRQSRDRPMGDEVVRIFRGMAGELSPLGVF